MMNPLWKVKHEIPQGSVLRPMLFTLYLLPLSNNIIGKDRLTLRYQLTAAIVYQSEIYC